MEYCELFETRSFCGGRLNFFQKQGDYSHSGRRGELNQNGEISPSDGERWQVCKIVRCDVFSFSQKLFAAIKKECVISYSQVPNRRPPRQLILLKICSSKQTSSILLLKLFISRFSTDFQYKFCNIIKNC